MKRKLFLLVICASLLLTRCKKDDADPTPTNTTTNPVSTTAFTWTTNTGTSVTADSAHYYNGITTIYAFKSGLSNSFEINLSSLSAATYTISSATGDALTFVTANTTYTAHSGIVTITSNAGNKMSGNFNAALSGGTLTSVSGTFKDLPGRN